MTVYNGVYTSIDITGGTQTQAVSINATGQIVGNYVTGTGINTVRHGFLDDAGIITTIDVPPAVAGDTVTTAVASINDSGLIIGNYEEGSSPEQGFLDITTIQNGVVSNNFTTIDVPGSSETEPSAINASGEIVGRYQGSDGAEHGFLDITTIQNGVVSNNFITIDGPVVNPAPGHATFTFASAINASGQIVGHYYDYDTSNPQNPVQGPLHGFFRAIDGTITPIDVPPAVAGDTVSTNPTSINASGEIVGFYQEGSGGQYQGFLDTAFTTSGGTITTIDVPGAIYTQALSINDSGEIVGVYEDSVTFQLHGFLDITTIQNGVVSNNFQTIDVPGAISTQATSINDNGQIVGFYQDSSGTQHAFATNIDQALTTTSEAFNYTAGTGVTAAVDLGNPISNDTDPNTGGGVISFQGFNSASFETPPPSSPSDLVNFVAGLTATVAGDVITITSNGLAATVTFDPTTGEESLSDPHNIFASLHSGESIVLDVGYTIKDNLGVLAPNDSQTITIQAAPQGNPFPSNLSNLVLYLQNSQGSIEKVIFENGAQLQFKTDSDIITWIQDHSNILNGYTTLDAFTYHDGPNNELNKTLASYMRPNEGQLVLTPNGNLPTNASYPGPLDFPHDNKSQLVNDLQNHNVDTPVQLVGTLFANGAHLHDGYALTITQTVI
jgi:uncharacterized membrane protein